MLQKFIEPDLAKIKVIQDAAAAEDAGYLEGYASVFGNPDLGGDVVEKGAFTKTLKERLKKGAIKLFDSHMLHQGTDAVIGLVEEAAEDDYGLTFKARFSSTTRAQDVRRKVQEGILNALSFGYEVVKDAMDPSKKVRLLKELKLYEVSVVPWGMNPKAMIEAVKGLVPISDFALAPKDNPWTEEDALSRLADWAGVKADGEYTERELGMYRKSFLWVDGEKSSGPEAHHFPVVDIIDGEPKFVFAGVVAALEAVRSKADGPWSVDSDRIESELRVLFGKFGESFPERPLIIAASTKSAFDLLTADIRAASNRVYLETMLKGLGAR